jgi:GNAT superfamily N-acetyltransferase
LGLNASGTVALQRAVEADYPAIVALTNKAYRSTGPQASWNVESFIEGERLTDELLRDDLAKAPDAHLLIWRDPDAVGAGEHVGHVWLEPGEDGAWYLGLLTVRPDVQDRKLGRSLLAASEDYARERGASRIELTVVDVRDTLIAWYERRGYARTGVTRPWPHENPRIGRPTREVCFVVLERAI